MLSCNKRSQELNNAISDTKKSWILNPRVSNSRPLDILPYPTNKSLRYVTHIIEIRFHSRHAERFLIPSSLFAFEQFGIAQTSNEQLRNCSFITRAAPTIDYHLGYGILCWSSVTEWTRNTNTGSVHFISNQAVYITWAIRSGQYPVCWLLCSLKDFGIVRIDPKDSTSSRVYIVYRV